MKSRLNPREVRDLLGVTNYALKYFRDPARLPNGIKNPLYLPAIPDPNNKNVIWYELETVREFIQRNEKYRERVYASFVPPDVMTYFFPKKAA